LTSDFLFMGYNCIDLKSKEDIFLQTRLLKLSISSTACLEVLHYTQVSRRMRWAGHVARMGVERGVHRVLVGKADGKRQLGRPRCRWEDNIKMDLQ
jgi:hypothetical protein